MLRRLALLPFLLLACVAARAQAPGWTGAVPGSLSQANGDASGNVFVTG